MKRIVKSLFFLCVMLVVGVAVNTEQASATFEDGRYTTTKKVIVPMDVKPGDIIKVEYQAEANPTIGNLRLTNLDAKVFFHTWYGEKLKKVTLEYTFVDPYEGFIVFSAGDKSIDNRIYAIYLNGKMVFDGVSIVKEYIKLNADFLEIKDLTFNSSRIQFNGAYLPLGYVINTILISDTGQVFEQTNSNLNHILTNLKADTEYKYIIRVDFTNGERAEDLTITFKTEKLPDVIVNAKDVQSTSANLKFGYDRTPSEIKVYNSQKVLIDTLPGYSQTYKLNNLKSDTEHNFYVQYTFAGDNETPLKKVIFKTLEIPKEVQNIKAKVSFKDVALSWENTQHEDFEKVTIYRKNNESDGIVSKVRSFFVTNDEYDPLFETNGTTFKDLTVKQDTSYTYLLTSTIANNETDGVKVQVKTPKLSVIDPTLKEPENETDDYVITWSDPTKGEIQVLIGGKLYKTVAAADKKISIPQKNMKYDILGKPDVKLIPIDDDGTPGIPNNPMDPTKPDGLGGLDKIDGKAGEILNPKNLLFAGVGLLSLVGMFVLLSLAFKLVPKLINIVRAGFQAAK